MTSPHCDELVLHAPGECNICDKYAGEQQALRIRSGINFTGQHKPDRGPCPSELRRPLEVIQAWPGNQPSRALFDGLNDLRKPYNRFEDGLSAQVPDEHTWHSPALGLIAGLMIVATLYGMGVIAW
jgi:hypothetical protein